MGLPKGLKVTEGEVSQTINLNEITGADLSGAPDLVDEIGQAIIDFIKGRAEDGLGVGGVALKSPYSKEYSESLPFKAAGKSRSEVNMTLSGDMLGAIDILGDDDGVVKIGFDSDQETIKAYGHMTGFRGHPTIKSGPRRPFFGVTKDELKEIISKFSDEISDVREQSLEQEQERTERAERLRGAAREIRSAADLFDLEDENQ